MAQVDPSKFSGRGINGEPRWYDGKTITSYRLKQWRQLQRGGASTRVTTIPNQYKKYFPADTKFTSRQGHIKSWAKPMTARGGPNPNYNWGRVNYRDFNGQIGRTASNQRWGVNVSKSNIGGVLVGTKQWIRQLQVALHALYINAENFRVVVGQRALKVFQNSIRYQKFYSNNGKAWPDLATFTKKMRTKRGTGYHILQEYGRLLNSIQIDPSNPGRIETKPVYISKQWQTGKNSKFTQTTIKKVAFAGYHNEGKGHHGPIPTKYKRRQFMGHSSFLNPYTDSFMRKMMKLYLFDNVFMVKK